MTQFLRCLPGRLHGERRHAEKAIGACLHELGDLLVLDAGEHARQRWRLRINECLRTHREHLDVDLRGAHVVQPPLQVPAAARKVPVDVAGNVECAELVIDPRQLGGNLRRLSLQEPDRLLGQDMGVNIDGFGGHGATLMELRSPASRAQGKASCRSGRVPMVCFIDRDRVAESRRNRSGCSINRQAWPAMARRRAAARGLTCRTTWPISRHADCCCGSSGPSTRTPSCIRWCAGSSWAAYRRRNGGRFCSLTCGTPKEGATTSRSWLGRSRLPPTFMRLAWAGRSRRSDRPGCGRSRIRLLPWPCNSRAARRSCSRALSLRERAGCCGCRCRSRPRASTRRPT